MRPTIFLFFLILLTPTALAFNCSFFEGNITLDCEELNEVNESLIADLIYTNTTIPNHDFVKDYNDAVVVDNAPQGYAKYSKGVIKDAWVALLSISPSIYFQNNTFVPENVEIRSEYDYGIQIPEDYYNSNKIDGAVCKRLYSLESQNYFLNVLVNGDIKGSTKTFSCTITEDSLIQPVLGITAITREEEYVWDSYCCDWEEGDCVKYCYSCDYDDTDFITDTLVISDELQTTLYKNNPNISFTIIESYNGANKGILNPGNTINLWLSFNNSFLSQNNFEYSARFIKKPFYLLQIEAEQAETTKYQNIIRNGNTIYIKDASNCGLIYSDFFTTETKACKINLQNNSSPIEPAEFDSDWSLLLKVVIFVLALYLIYIILRKFWPQMFG